jgi:AAA+ ATPase superfamily predicted ATPase
MTNSIIGRRDEQKTLKRLLNSSKAEFIAIYGRRRVGKTYLIRNFFKEQRCVYFEATGLKDGNQSQQLKLFVDKISEVFYEGLPLQVPQSWLDAFKLLTTALEKERSIAQHPKKFILFIDEIPWFSTPKSGFIQALDYYWNTKWSTVPTLKLIVCGSAASWMLDTLVHAKGGLHNRLTAIIPLRPFTLKETQEYLTYNGVKFNKRQMIDVYMVIGGIPHYLNGITPGFSVTQSLNQLCFQKDGFLFSEFKILFSSLFDSSEAHNELIRIIARARQGVSREEILKKAIFSSSGGMLKKRLIELEEAGFIASFTPYGNVNKGTFFRVIDEYSLFYLRWIEPVSKRLTLTLKNESYWESKMQSQSWRSWAGYAFEAICLKHIEQIKQGLGISVISSTTGSWREISKQGGEGEEQKEGCQIDLLIDRADGIINLCEIKFHQGKFSLTKKDAENIRKKVSLYQNHTKTNKPIYVTLITPEGIQPNAHSNSIVMNEITMKDLFG